MSDAQPRQTLETASVAERRGTGRSIAAAVCIVLAALLTTPAAIAYWGQRTLNDTQRYVDTVGPLVESPEVQDAIATTVTDAIQSAGGRGGDPQRGIRRCHYRPPAAAAVSRAVVRRDQRADRPRGPGVRGLGHLRRHLGQGEYPGAADAGARPAGGRQRRRFRCRATRSSWTCPRSSRRFSSAWSIGDSRSWRTCRFPTWTSKSCCWTLRSWRRPVRSTRSRTRWPAG